MHFLVALIDYRHQLKGRIPMNQLTFSDMEYSNRKKKTKHGEKIFADVNSRLDKAGLMMHGDIIVDDSLTQNDR